MSIELLIILIIVAFVVLLLSGLPVVFSLFGLSMLFIAIFIGPKQLQVAYTGIFGTITKEIFIAIPLFIFMAAVLQNSGLGSALYETMYRWFGGFRGGLAIGTVVIATLIAAMTGLGGTDVVIMGMLAYPEMRKRGYSKSMALGCIPAGGALGPLIPPSVVMIAIAGLGAVSVGRMFMGGVFPGLLMAFLFIVYIAVRAFLQPHLAPALPPAERATWKQKMVSLRGVVLPLILILLVLGTIYTGIATPTEAGGIGAFGALVCAAIYRQFNWRNLRDAAFMTLKVNVMVMWLLMGGSVFASFLTMVGVSQFISGTVAGLTINPTLIVFGMMFVALVMGMFIPAAAIIMILIPIFMPIIYQLGIDPTWFAVLFTINMVIGYITPPFGMNLFYMKGVAPPDVTMADLYRSIIPYTLLMFIGLIVALLYPPLLMWLPGTMFK